MVTFGDEVTKILGNLYLHYARQDGQDIKKQKEDYANKMTKIPKNQKTRIWDDWNNRGKDSGQDDQEQPIPEKGPMEGCSVLQQNLNRQHSGENGPDSLPWFSKCCIWDYQLPLGHIIMFYW